MNFTKGQKVKLKDEIAVQLEATVGTWDNEFTGLVGLVGRLYEPIFKEGGDWQFITPTKKFGVLESEIEAVQE